jgi:hypothetical protein
VTGIALSGKVEGVLSEFKSAVLEEVNQKVDKMFSSLRSVVDNFVANIC